MSIRIGAIIYFIAAFIQIFAPNLGALIAGRSIQGLGVGMLSMTVPILQCEIAPGHARGLFISIEYLCLNLGYLISAWVGYGFFFALPSEISWRGPYIVQAVLAGILTAWSFILPETPRFLISNGFEEEGLRVLADLHAAGNQEDPAIQKSFAEISAAVKYERTLQQASWGQLFTQYTRRTIMGITCQLFAQFNGINALLYFLPSNLTRAGFTIPRSLLYTGVAAIVYCVGTIPTMFLIDRWGRRVFFITGSFALAACLGTVGGLQYKGDSLVAYLTSRSQYGLGSNMPVPLLFELQVGSRALSPRCGDFPDACKSQRRGPVYNLQLALQLYHCLHHSPAILSNRCGILLHLAWLLCYLGCFCLLRVSRDGTPDSRGIGRGVRRQDWR